MSRVVRFRAWDKHQQKMVTDVTLGDARVPSNFDTMWEVMQFTGLKDKNGTEVYEGDVVRCSAGCPHVVEWREELGGKFIGGMPGWYLSGLLSGGGEGYAWTGSEEVIGNIHQNPELIKETA